MPGSAVPVVLPTAGAAPWSTPISNFFVGSLCLGGLAELATVTVRGQAGRLILLTTLLVQLGAAVAVLVQNYMGRLRPAMRNLAITALVTLGAWYYAVQIGGSMAIAYQTGAQSRNPKVFAPQTQQWILFEYPLARGSAGGVTLLLGLVGVILGIRGERPQEERVSFNV